MAELTILGEIRCAKGFAYEDLFVKYYFVAGTENWRILSGEGKGQTWTAAREFDDHLYTDEIVFNQNIDLTYAVSGLDGWPKLLLEVGFVDSFGRNDVAGYGFCFVPSAPGHHNIDVQIFRPTESLYQTIASWFLGGYPRYPVPEVILSGAPRFSHRTESTGLIEVTLNTLCKGFDDLGVTLDCAEGEQPKFMQPVATNQGPMKFEMQRNDKIDSKSATMPISPLSPLSKSLPTKLASLPAVNHGAGNSTPVKVAPLPASIPNLNTTTPSITMSNSLTAGLSTNSGPLGKSLPPLKSINMKLPPLGQLKTLAPKEN